MRDSHDLALVLSLTSFKSESILLANVGHVFQFVPLSKVLLRESYKLISDGFS